MEEAFREWLTHAHWSVLAAIIAACLYVVGRAADRLVEQAVILSRRSRIPKTVIGATVVSLGTTTPEAAVSVLAAIEGAPDLALGNAVGSIICDTGLILGLACLIAPLRLDRRVVNRQGWIQLGSALALVLVSAPWPAPWNASQTGGTMSQWMGFAFLAALAAYLYKSVQWARSEGLPEELEEAEDGPAWIVLLKLTLALAFVVISARVLIPAVEEAALRMAVPESVVAATLVAFGTSLPELVTAVTAARRGHGELAVGNIVGADILNALFVAGAAAAVTPAGLYASPHFFLVLYPTMIFILVVFRLGVLRSREYLGRPFGYVLLAAYLFVSIISYLIPGAPPAH